MKGVSDTTAPGHGPLKRFGSSLVEINQFQRMGTTGAGMVGPQLIARALVHPMGSASSVARGLLGAGPPLLPGIPRPPLSLARFSSATLTFLFLETITCAPGSLDLIFPCLEVLPKVQITALGLEFCSCHLLREVSCSHVESALP